MRVVATLPCRLRTSSKMWRCKARSKLRRRILYRKVARLNQYRRLQQLPVLRKRVKDLQRKWIQLKICQQVVIVLSLPQTTRRSSRCIKPRTLLEASLLCRLRPKSKSRRSSRRRLQARAPSISHRTSLTSLVKSMPITRNSSHTSASIL